MSGIEAVAEDLYKFAHKQLQFNKPCRIVFESQGDRAVDIFSPTGNYKPDTHTVTIYVDHRHPKDILRSMAHELIHHAQCCAGQFNQGLDTSPGYAQKDQHMREMEKDAYFRGNITLFRDWEDNYKQGRNIMEEGKKAKKDYDGDGKAESGEDEYLGSRDKAIKKAMGKEDVDEVKHDCANHVKENTTGREGHPINHTLLEDGTVTHYTVEFQNEIVENIPVEDLTILAQEAHHHAKKRDDKEHNESKARRAYVKEEEETSDKEWYQNQLHDALLKKFNIKK